MTSRRILFLSVSLFLVWFLITTILHSNFGGHVRYFSDDHDRRIYFDRGAWLKKGQVPYRDVVSEYPQVPTLLFGLLRIPFLGEKKYSIAYRNYSALFSFAMLIILFALINLLYQLLPNAKYRSFLLMLPAPLYFTLNRYDVLPAFLCLVSLALVRDKKWGMAAIILGIAAMTKWYPLLLLPAYLAYFYRVEGSINWRMIVLFSATCFLIILPTLLLGGIHALLVPYRFQGIRGLEVLSLPAMISKLEGSVSQTPMDQRYYIFGFLLLQVITSIVSFFARIDKFEKLLLWCILIITMFILFARILFSAMVPVDITSTYFGSQKSI